MKNSSKSVVASIGGKRRRTLYCKPLPTLALLCAAVFICNAFMVTDCNKKLSALETLDYFLGTGFSKCQENWGPTGIKALPRGIVSSTSNLEMRPLWGPPTKKKSNKMNLLAMAVGMKQKASIDKIVKKFIGGNSVVMLFHYDGNVDDWREFEWSARALHIAASNQTKWWFAKRFLHPDIVSEYSYIFLWNDDLGVENFNVQRYLYVVKREGLEISQPALDLDKSEVHEALTARQTGSLVDRWVKMMAPVFSRAAWHCVWYLIQDDLVHAWGVNFQLGYCAQGDGTKNIGIVDSDYAVHLGLPTLGGASGKVTDGDADDEVTDQTAEKVSSLDTLQETLTSSNPDPSTSSVRKLSIADVERFKNRWRKAVKDDDS